MVGTAAAFGRGLLAGGDDVVLVVVVSVASCLCLYLILLVESSI